MDLEVWLRCLSVDWQSVDQSRIKPEAEISSKLPKFIWKSVVEFSLESQILPLNWLPLQLNQQIEDWVALPHHTNWTLIWLAWSSCEMDAQWQGTYVACRRSCVQFSALPVKGFSAETVFDTNDLTRDPGDPLPILDSIDLHWLMT